MTGSGPGSDVTAAPRELVGVDDPTHVVEEPHEFTPEWMTGALRRGGGLDVAVAATTYERIGTGQIGASYRVTLTYDGPRDGAPDSVVVKVASGSDEARALLGRGFANEVGVYLQLADRLRIRRPKCWYGAITPDYRRFTLVLEDLAPWVPGRQADGCGVERATAAARNLAGLHAPFWNDESLRTGLAWLQPLGDGADGAAFLGALHVDATEKFIDRFGAALPDEDADTLRSAAALTAHWAAELQHPFSLLHGDYRLDNLMFPVHGSGVAALDWQTASVGHPLRDLAYFLSASLPVAERRRTEDGIVAAYHAELVAQGVTDYPAETCFTDYRIGMLHGPLITVLGCVYSSGEQTAEADAMFLSMAAHAAQAIRDLDTLTAAAS